MIVDNPTCLQMGVDRDRSNIFEATLLQVTAYLLGKTVANRNWLRRMSLIQDRLPPPEKAQI